jgi:hypothetical protein
MTVYFVKRHGDDSQIKIGTARDVDQRVRGLTSSLGAVELMGVMTGDASLERLLHYRFHADRVEGEWFKFSDDLKAFYELEVEKRFRLYEPKQASWKVAHAANAIQLDQAVAYGILERCLAPYSVSTGMGAALEKVYLALSERNAFWSRRRVRAIHEMKARRIDLFEVMDLLTLANIEKREWPDFLRPDDKVAALRPREHSPRKLASNKS